MEITIYNYFRDYDAVTGRYVESDPIGLTGGINTYGYALADPVDSVDPFGLWVKLCGRGLGDPTRPAKRITGAPYESPLRHDYLSVSGYTLMLAANWEYAVEPRRDPTQRAGRQWQVHHGLQ